MRRVLLMMLSAVLAAMLLVPSCAFASEDASAVVTVPGSVSSVTGTVTLSTGTIAGIGEAVAAASSSSIVATTVLSPAYDHARDAVYYGMLLLAFWAALLGSYRLTKG